MVYQVHTPPAAPATANHPTQSVEEQGPMKLARPEVADAPAPVPGETTQTENRYAFLDWFGNAAERAKVRNSAAVLRQSRDLTATLGTDVAVADRQTTIRIGENSRLVPTYEEGLPEPQGQEPALRPSDITGSVTRTPARREAEESPPRTQTSPGDEFADLERRLTEARRKLEKPKTTRTVVASRAPSPEPSAPALPDGSNPLLMQLEPGRHGFNSSELAALKRLAGQQVRSGRKLHIRAVARGRAGDAETSLERVRRLKGHTRTALAALRHYGVDPRNVETSSAEQRVAGNTSDTETLADRDRLEFSFR